MAALLKSPRRLFAFLRAINVGGRNISMAELRRVFEGLGFKEVETFIASGNIVFKAEATDLPALEIAIEARLLKSLGYEVKTFLRTEQELAAITEHKAFKGARLETAQALNVALLSMPPGHEAKRLTTAFKTDNDEFHVHGREVYWLCQTKQSDSKFNNVRFEKLLNARATWRGINTIRRLAEKYVPSG